jgi:hypothetical protein
MDFDWKSIIGSIAPTIATALGGPLAGLGVKAIAGALGLSDGAGEKDVAAAVQNASPDQLLAIQKADQDFAIRMQELGVDLEKIAGADRADARNREIQLRDRTPAILAYAVTVGFFGTLLWMLSKGIPQGSEALYIMLGSLGTAWSGIIAYFYGSSAGSAAKTAMLGKKV